MSLELPNRALKRCFGSSTLGDEFAHGMYGRRKLLDLLLVTLLFSALIVTTSADDGARIPPPLKFYKGRQIAPTMGHSGAWWLTRDVREQEEHSTTMLRALQVEPGQTVCDLGCGNGYHALRLAKLVGRQGTVLAVDIQQEMLDMLEERAKQHEIRNIKTVLGTIVDPKLPRGSVDMFLLVDVYHEFSHPEHMLQAIRRSLKPAGLVALVEFREEDPSVPIKPLHKMSKKQILIEFPANGFKLVRQFDRLPWQHVMFFQRDDRWMPE